jgi:predicted nucleotidyltransferase
MNETSNAMSQLVGVLVAKLVAAYQPQQVILFGSQAYGEPTADSDIDLLIIKETNERFIDRWMTVRRILSDATRTVGLETLVLTPQELAKRLAMGDQFVQEIVQKGKVLYAA